MKRFFKRIAAQIVIIIWHITGFAYRTSDTKKQMENLKEWVEK